MTLRIILLSGGIGKRLWPLSTVQKSKQFLSIYENEHGNKETMLQRVWKQLDQSGITDFKYIATCEDQKAFISKQLHDNIPVIAEPERKNTFSAIALAICYLNSIVEADHDDVVCVLPVDIHVEKDFFHTFVEAAAILQETEANLVLVGVNPTSATTQYGYIIPNKNEQKEAAREVYFKVGGFVEKPNAIAAEKLRMEQALWNCGVFTFKLSYMLDILSQRNMPVEYDKMLAFYSQMPSTSFDIEVVEREKSTYAIKYDGHWTDMGSWTAILQNMRHAQAGKGMIDECDNARLINETDLDVILIGLHDILVVVSENGILIANQSDSHKVKKVLDSRTRPENQD